MPYSDGPSLSIKRECLKRRGRRIQFSNTHALPALAGSYLIATGLIIP